MNISEEKGEFNRYLHAFLKLEFFLNELMNPLGAGRIPITVANCLMYLKWYETELEATVAGRYMRIS